VYPLHGGDHTKPGDRGMSAGSSAAMLNPPSQAGPGCVRSEDLFIKVEGLRLARSPIAWCKAEAVFDWRAARPGEVSRAALYQPLAEGRSS